MAKYKIHVYDSCTVQMNSTSKRGYRSYRVGHYEIYDGDGDFVVGNKGRRVKNVAPPSETEQYTGVFLPIEVLKLKLNKNFSITNVITPQPPVDTDDFNLPPPPITPPHPLRNTIGGTNRNRLLQTRLGDNFIVEVEEVG